MLGPLWLQLLSLASERMCPQDLSRGDAGHKPRCTCPKAGGIAQQGAHPDGGAGAPGVSGGGPRRRGLRVGGRTALGRPPLPPCSRAPVPPFVEHTHVLPALAREPLAGSGVASGLERSGGLFSVCSRSPVNRPRKLLGNSSPDSDGENRRTGLRIWEEHHGLWDVRPGNGGRDV